MRSPLPGLVILIAACTGGGDGGDDPDAAPSPLCEEATEHEDLTWIQAEVFSRSCTFMACHDADATDARGLSLVPGVAHGELVNRASGVVPTEMLVAPGDPAASYLMVALGEYAGTLPMGGTMPLSSPPLCAEKRGAIERWIAAGALP